MRGFELIKLKGPGRKKILAVGDARKLLMTEVSEQNEVERTRTVEIRREKIIGSGKEGLSPFLTGRMFLREPSWKYSAKLVGS